MQFRRASLLIARSVMESEECESLWSNSESKGVSKIQGVWLGHIAVSVSD